jgi:uncharacterized protein (TIGR03437 family)
MSPKSTLAAALLLAACASAQQLTVLPPGGPAPEARIDGTIAYDPVARDLYLFGGDGARIKNDLWAYSIDRQQWREVTARNPPPARFGHTLIFDPARRRLMLFGGEASGFFNDTWAFDIATAQWELVNSGTDGPSRRYGHSGVYDAPRHRMIISHGFTSAGRFDDTWALDLATYTWRDISPQTRPLRRCLHHAAVDPAREVMYLYGGCASGTSVPNNCPLGDLWAFDLRTHRWAEVVRSPAPPPRQWYGLGFDPTRGRLVVFAGSGRGRLADLWEFDPSASRWSEASLDPAAPPRDRHEAAYVPDLDGIVFFGGNGPAGKSSDLVLWGPPPPAASVPSISAGGVVPVFSNRGDALAPGMIAAIYGQRLGPADPITTRFDSQGRLPDNAGGVSVELNGIRAPIFYAAPGQVNVQVPYEAPPGEAEIRIRNESGETAPYRVRVEPTAPDLFPGVFTTAGVRIGDSNPAAAGDIVILFATGAGAESPAAVTGAAAAIPLSRPAAAVRLSIGGRDADILYAGAAPGTAGLTQINARVPAGLEPGEVEAILEAGTRASRAVLLKVR